MTPFRSQHSQFGRRPPRPSMVAAADAPGWAIGAELRLFALTFAGGFLFMSVYLA